MLSVSTGCFMTHDYEYVKGVLEQTSADSIEVIVYRTYMNNLSAIKKFFSNSDIPIASVHACKSIQTIISTPGKENEAKRLIMDTVDLAAELSAEVVVVHAWDGRCYSLDLISIQNCIRECSEYASGQGISLSIEAVPSRAYYPPDLIGRFLAADSFSTVTIDFEYASMYGMYEDMMEYCPRISNVHLRDYKGQWIIDGRRIYIKPGDGAVDFKDKINLLKKNGYEGLYTIEAPHCSIKDLENTMSYFRDLI